MSTPLALGLSLVAYFRGPRTRYGTTALFLSVAEAAWLAFWLLPLLYAFSGL